MSDVFALFSALCSLIFFIMICVTISRIGDIRDHAQRQTRLLEQLVKNATPAAPPAVPIKPTAAANYITNEPKTGAGTVALLLAAVLVIVIVVIIASKK